MDDLAAVKDDFRKIIAAFAQLLRASAAHINQTEFETVSPANLTITLT